MSEHFFGASGAAWGLALCAAAVVGCGRGGKRDPGQYWSDPKSVALAKAIGRGDLAEIDRLVADGADVNSVGKEYASPLAWAIARQQKEAYKRLLAHGADPSVRYREHPSIVHLVAGADKDSDWLRLVLEHGGDPNSPGFPVPPGGDHLDAIMKEKTPIFDAIESRRKESLDLLIKAGADIDHADATGETPLIYAASLNWFDSVYYLLEAGADYRKKQYGRDVTYEIIHTSVDPESDLGKWREKVIDWLRQRGVTFDDAVRILEEEAANADAEHAAIFNATLKQWREEEEARSARRPPGRG